MMKTIIKFVCTIVAIIFSFQLGMAQNKSLYTAGISLAPTIGSAINTSDVYLKYKDAVNSKQQESYLIGIHGWINYSLKKKLDLQIGIGYQQVGFSRLQTGLKFKNVTYPGIGNGTIQDLSNTEKNITYNYRFNYIQVPVLLNFYLKRSRDFKIQASFTCGLAANILLNHKMIANLNPGFTIDSKKSFDIDSTGFDASRIVPSIIIGSRFDYKVDKKMNYFVQPMAVFYPFSVSNSKNISYPWYLSLNIGVTYSLAK